MQKIQCAICATKNVIMEQRNFHTLNECHISDAAEVE